MKYRSFLLSLLLCLVVASGCAAKKTTTPVVSGFPEKPHATMQKNKGPQASSVPGGSSYAIAGGWGYGQASAMVLAVPQGKPKQHYNNTIPLESKLVRLRNEVEFSQTPTKGQRLLVVDHGKVARTVSTRNGKMYAVWRAHMHVIAERTAPALYEDLCKKNLQHRATSASRAISRPVLREYWFDVTDTFNAKHTRKKPEAAKFSGAKL